MNRIYLVIPLVALTSACETTNQNESALAGAAAGAALGAAINEDEPVEGALLGGAAGAVAGSLLGRANTPGDCVYVDRFGNRYVAECP